jgi:hypothetical protein
MFKARMGKKNLSVARKQVRSYKINKVIEGALLS